MTTQTTSHTPGPWAVQTWQYSVAGREAVPTIVARGKDAVAESMPLWSDSDADREEERRANAQLIAAAPELLEALEITAACGSPEMFSMYDEEGVEGWRWVHPDGREWHEVGIWDEDPPMHPVASSAIAKATGGNS